MTEERESIVAALFQSYLDLLLSRGVAEPLARDMAKRSVHAILETHGARYWYFPRASVLAAEALDARNDAIRAAHRRNVPKAVILRTFRISRARYYQILKAG